MFFRYDFHNHSCLSPCGDDDMTPNNFVNMAKLLSLDIVALTDHNSALNTPAAVEAGKKIGLTVIPGMELCTREEIHVVCLFKTVSSALDFSSLVKNAMPPVKNKPEIFGRQLILNSYDEPQGEEELLLSTAAGIGIFELKNLLKPFDAAAFPAHINRSSYSVTAALGTINSDMGFSCAELTQNASLEEFENRYPDLKRMTVFHDSDAHRLEDMNMNPKHIDLPECSAEAVVDFINSEG